MAPLVREAEMADAAAIAHAHVRSWQSGYVDVVSNDFLKGLSLDLPRRTLLWQTRILGAEAEGTFVLVGEIDGEVAGWLSCGTHRGADIDVSSLGEVYACYVDPVYWRQGVGSALMDVALERLAHTGFTKAVLWVLADNSLARSFYEHHGWRTDGAQKMYELANERYLEVRYRRSLP
jgi:ribosomal protein S18 acetylase RimI-like enzyme